VRPVFADTFFFLALLSRRDAHHAAAVRLMREVKEMVTTAWVLMEVADAMCLPSSRSAVVTLFRHLYESSEVTIVPASSALFLRALSLYEQRPDKSWSLTDCSSFISMQDKGIALALTADHHFEQAGFQITFKNP